jgi:small-conductance mechanosensitive channel
MIRLFLLCLLLLSSLLAQKTDAQNIQSPEYEENIFNSKNIWIKTFTNNKNYYTIINNIVKIEQKIKKNQGNTQTIDVLMRRLELQNSKLELYEKNKSFDTLLMPFRYYIPEITGYDYFFQDSQKDINKLIDKFIALKNEFNLAYSLLQNYHKKDSKKVTQDDLKYFEEFSENIDKVYLNLLEAKDELSKKYEEYYYEKLQKHLTTLIMLLIAYLLYRVFLAVFEFIEKKLSREHDGIYKKLLSMMFYLFLTIALVIRYMEDFIYIITFLSVVAAALTIALREVLLNIVASIYIFFSNMLRVGDRVMVQFETKHTIGDIVDISLMKIKLHEINDYNNLKEIKSVGRTIYIPNSYVFSKVFYNYSRKKNGFINDLIEFEFNADNDFEKIEGLIESELDQLGIEYTLSFSLNNLKTGVVALISYTVNYKTVSKKRGEISIALLKAFKTDKSIKLKNSKTSTRSSNSEGE